MADSLDGNDHVARHLISRDVDDDVIGISAFHARDGDDCVSVYHLEYFVVCDQPRQLKCVQQKLKAAKDAGYRDGRDVRASHRFAVLNVEQGAAAVEHVSKAVAFSADPRPGVGFHAGIFGYSNDQAGAQIAAALRDRASLSPQMKDLPPPGDGDCDRR